MVHREDAKERVDRELTEFLAELRVAVAGVSVLFAFLLTVPFNQRFTALSATEVKVYLGAVVSTALASGLMIAPAAQHRLRFRQVDKAQLLAVTTRLTVAGHALLAVAMAASLHVTTSLLYGGRIATAVAGSVGLLVVTLWFGIPLLYRGSPHDEEPD